VLRTPPNAGGGFSETLKSVRAAMLLRGLTPAEQRLIADLFTKSASDFLNQWFENETVKALFGFDGIVGSYAAPSTPRHRLRAAAPLLR
jgi:phytoene dehydrogenase-like protein